MDNFQLYRTNVMLGGQMKWDLILDSFESDLIVKDFHISPICDSVPYNKYSQESLLNYSHQENIKKYYKKISGSFYENYTDPKLESAWPIITDIPLDTHVGNFEMGCRRSLYKIYNKQFEFFCPIWLEQLDGDLIFELSAYTRGNNKILQKRLEFKPFGNHNYHNKFVNYFKNYIKYIGVDRGNDNIMSIHLDKGVAQLCGLNVQTGLNSTLDISYIVDNLISRERPLLEFDNIIINQIKDHKLIVPQLFNFNLCFNPEDILPYSFINMMCGKTLSFNLKVFVGDKELEIKDFYSNYEYIPRKYVGPIYATYPEQTPNVLDYLQDYKCIDLIDKNKMVQNTIHWSLADNNDYIFNIYEGFKGFSILNGEIVNHAHLYDDSPNIHYENYKQYFNNIGWSNYMIIENSNENGKVNEPDFWINFGTYVNKSSDFSEKNEWVNKIKYNTSEFETEYKNIKVLLLINNTEKLLNVKKFGNDSNFETYNFSIPDMIIQNNAIENDINILQVILYKSSFTNEYYILFSIDGKNGDFSKLTFYNIHSYLISIIENKHISDDAKKVLLNLRIKMDSVNSSNNPPIIIPKSSLNIIKENGPSLSTKEITYHKNNNPGEYVLRYFGKIKPTFISSKNDINFNYLYYKDYLSDNRSNGESEYQKSKYCVYAKTKYTPIYPSIDYFSIKKIKQNYIDIPITYKNDIMLNNIEYHWFNNNKNIILSSDIDVQLNSIKTENGEYETVEKLIKMYLSEYYKINDMDVVDYIYKLYNVNSSFDYVSKYDINDYIYTIKLTLK